MGSLLGDILFVETRNKSFFRSSEQLRQVVRFFREFSVFWGIECESERFHAKSETFRENVLGTSAQKV